MFREFESHSIHQTFRDLNPASNANCYSSFTYSALPLRTRAIG